MAQLLLQGTRVPLLSVKTIRNYGTSTWNEATLAALNTKIDGWIEKLNVNETGRLVRKGHR